MSKRLDLRFICYSFACLAVLGVGVYSCTGGRPGE